MRKHLIASVVGGTLACGALLPQAGQAASIHGDSADYMAYKETSFFSTRYMATNASTSTMNIINRSSSISQDNRGIFQFDLGTTTQITQASLRMKVFKASGSATYDYDPTYNINLYGSTDNRASAQTADANGASAEYYDTSYTRLDTDSNPFADATFREDEWVEMDVTSFLQDRLDDMQATGDSYVFFRLQADASTSGSEQFQFYTADSSLSDAPRLNMNVSTVPVPAPLGLLAAGLAGFGWLGRRHGKHG